MNNNNSPTTTYYFAGYDFIVEIQKDECSMTIQILYSHRTMHIEHAIENRG